MTEGRVDKLEDKIDKIMTELIGDEAFGRIGIAARLRNIESVQFEQGKEIQKIKNRLFRDKIVIGTWMVTIGTIFGWLSKTWVGKLVVFAGNLFR